MKDIREMDEVHHINDFHVWALSGNKNILTAQIYLKKFENGLDYR